MSDNANREKRKDRFTKNGEGERKREMGKTVRQEETLTEEI